MLTNKLGTLRQDGHYVQAGIEDTLEVPLSPLNFMRTNDVNDGTP